MRNIVVMITLLVFTVPMAFAGGGPSFEQLYTQSNKDKRVVELIDPSSKDVSKQEICLRNIAQNKVERKPC